MELTKNLSPGRTDVIYSARSPVTNNTVSCRLIITVVDKEVPQVINCPNNIEYRLSPHEYNKVMYWSEPEFTDNVKVVGVYKSRVSIKNKKKKLIRTIAIISLYYLGTWYQISCGNPLRLLYCS